MDTIFDTAKIDVTSIIDYFMIALPEQDKEKKPMCPQQMEFDMSA